MTPFIFTCFIIASSLMITCSQPLTRSADQLMAFSLPSNTYDDTSRTSNDQNRLLSVVGQIIP